MNTKNLVLIGAGVLAGYLLVAYIRKNKPTEEVVLEEETITISPAEQAKIDACNAETDLMMKSSKFTGKTDLVKVRKDFFDACLAKKA